jgi:hypothetical protein
MPNLYKVQDHGRDLLGRSNGLSHDAMVGGYIIFNAHNSSFTPKFTTSFCPSYFMTQEASVAPRVSATK